MSKQLVLFKCPVQGHDPSMQDSVCLDNQCQSRGLVCDKCSASNHSNHYKLPLANFVDQYRECQNLSNIEQQMDNDTKSLQSMQAEIKGHLQSFMKTIQDEVLKTLERLQTQFDSDVQQIQSMKAAEQRYTQILKDIERKNIANAQEAQRKVTELVLKVQLQPNKRFQLFSVNEEGFQKIKTTLRNTMSAKENVYTETTKIAKDTQRYLDGVYRFLSATLQKGSNFNQPMHSGTFGQFGQTVNHNEPEQFKLTSELNPPTANFILENQNNQSLNGQRSFSNNASSHNFHSSLPQNNMSRVDEQLPSGMLTNNNSVNINNRNTMYNHSSPTKVKNTSTIFGKGVSQSLSRQFNTRQMDQPINGIDNPVKQLHEFERNNENIFFQQQTGNNKSPSPFREEIHIQNSPLRSVGPSKSKTSNYFKQDVNMPAGTQALDQGYDRSFSLTNNIGKANTQLINAAHNQYFGEGPAIQMNPNTSRSMNQIMDQYNSSSSHSLNQLNNQRVPYAAINSNRVWWKSHDLPVRDIVFIDNDKIASASDDCTIKLWEKIEGKLLTTLTGHQRPVTSLAYHFTGRILASGSTDRTVKIWRPVPTWQCVHTFKGHNDIVRSLTFLNERTLYSGSLDSTVKVWDLEKGIFIRSLENEMLQKVHCMLLLQNKSLLVGYDKQICAWDLKSNQIIKNVSAHNSPVVRLIFVKSRRNDQPLIISGGRDSSVKIWEASTLIMLRSIEETFPITDIVYLSEIDCIAVSLVGQRLDGKIAVWNLNNLRKVRDIFDNPSAAYRLQYDENYRLLYSCHENRLVEYCRLQI
ncbi:WD domain, G-beta repeat protein (macronuclear) [Tetrahymena thermophila SB210]|uniref:WD domain, G-beta repeat protein n=1 Tax=Tetrahymena thermophila (strain SB210) TaxID=312017 RepID=A4VCU7_TETTS|nr:WD domain, G-beta repeat protein [Tetrahymena thermophila SB210]EDK31369.2 WD domain, G-beta repeat protein [Tetrahymena thermophila SB210]|eukprot:XP_001471042.2 WD domain, G-beta repeat protein [Tetrahymena thermophila SB210]